jgi:histidinol-phosphate aminotransferase
MDVSRFMRPHLGALQTYVPGKAIREQKNVLKLASNENLLGPPPSVVEAIRNAADRIHYYPDDDCAAVREKLAKRFDLAPANFMPVAGCAEAIFIISQTFLDDGDEFIVNNPGFPIFNIAGVTQNAKMVKVPVKGDFSPDTKGLAEAITGRTKLIWLDNPNNPCSTIARKPEVEKLIADISGRAIFIHDEAYFDFVQDPGYCSGLEHMRKSENVIVLRTFSKVYGLAGLRVGTIIAHQDIIAALQKVRMPFNVNVLAQAALSAALDDEEYLKESVRITVQSREMMAKLLIESGFKPVPSHTNFLLFDAGVDSVELAKLMNEHGVFIRPQKGAGLPNHIRASVPSNPIDCYRFIDTLIACQRKLVGA